MGMSHNLAPLLGSVRVFHFGYRTSKLFPIFETLPRLSPCCKAYAMTPIPFT
jgi:hypothetical protein